MSYLPEEVGRRIAEGDNEPEQKQPPGWKKPVITFAALLAGLVILGTLFEDEKPAPTPTEPQAQAQTKPKPKTVEMDCYDVLNTAYPFREYQASDDTSIPETERNEYNWARCQEPGQDNTVLVWDARTP